MILVRPLGMIFPVADATMSMVPHHDQSNVAQNRTAIVATIARPVGDGGVSTISSAAGRKASSSRRLSIRRNGTTISDRLTGSAAFCFDAFSSREPGPTSLENALSDDLIDSSLQPMQRGVASAGLDQRVVRAVLDQAAVV